MHTEFPEVNTILNTIESSVLEILQDSYLGLYLFGSLAIGDFDIETSDIDLVVATHTNLQDSQIALLSQFHEKLFSFNLPLCTELECLYLSKDNLRRYVPEKTICYKIDRGDRKLVKEILDIDWKINLFSLYNYGKTLSGPPITSIVAPISIDELKDSVLELINFWWLPMSQNPEKLKHEGYRFYAVLTMARMLATFDLKKIISKKEANLWSQENLDNRWKDIVLKAIERNKSCSINETQEFIIYTQNYLTKLR